MQELQSKERSLQQRILEQEKKEKQLDREKEEIKIKAERLELLIKQLSQQQSLDDGEEREGDERVETDGEAHGEDGPTPNQQQEVSVPRPPRLKPFSIRGLIKRMWNDRTGAKGRKVEGPLPNKVGVAKPKTTKRMMSSPVQPSKNPPVERREKRSNTTSLTTPEALAFGVLTADKRASLPNVNQPENGRGIPMLRGHRRLGSDDLKCKT